MRDASDMELLRNYARQNSEDAFAELVRRHVNLVYSAALRHVGMAPQAEEITQAVFVILSRKAASLRRSVVLEAWLFETTRLTALSFLRGERRRQFREQEAYMRSILESGGDAPSPSGGEEIWQQLAPLLDEAMMRLGRHEREAVVLRFFKGRSLGEVATALDIKEPAAQKRVGRALDKLRQFFHHRGVDSTADAITRAISAYSISIAPAGLAAAVTAAAKGAAASTTTLTLVKGALKIMAWTKMKTAAVAGAVLILLTGTTTIVVNQIHQNRQVQAQNGPSPDANVRAYKFNFSGMDPQQVLDIYRNLTGLKLNAAPIPSASIHLVTPKPLTKDEAIKLLEKTLEEQAGLVIKRLNDKQASVTYDPTVRIAPAQ